MNENVPDSLKVHANAGTQIIGVAKTVGALVSVFVVSRFKRITLLMASQISLSIMLLLTALFMQLANGYVTIILMSAFQIMFNITLAPIHWIYLPEVLNDTQMGIVLGTHYMVSLIFSITSEYMIEYMTPQGAFLLFGLMTTGTIFFVWFCMKETWGLSDKQKKQLYFPDEMKTVTTRKKKK